MNGAQELLVAIEHDLHVTVILLSAHHLMPQLHSPRCHRTSHVLCEYMNPLTWRVTSADDQCFGMIKWKQAAMGLQDFGLTLRNPDFVKLAEVCSIHHENGSCLWKGQRHLFHKDVNLVHHFL